MGDKLTITIPAGNTLPIAYNDCICDCHRIPNISHMAPCCSPTMEPCAEDANIPEFVEKHHDTVRQLSILAADRLSDERLDEIAHRLKMMQGSSYIIDVDVSFETLLNDVDSLIKHAKSLQFELDAQVNFK